MPMTDKMRGRILDRIAELSEGNESRLMDYLAGEQDTGETPQDAQDMPEYLPATINAARQKKLKENRRKAGMKCCNVWVMKDTAARLQAQYPGDRGGINWQAVINAALERNP